MILFEYTIPLGTPIPQNQQFAINVKKIPKSSEVVYGLAKIDPLQSYQEHRVDIRNCHITLLSMS